MKKILITGFSHCGTTILRCIIGHIADVYEVVDETPIVRSKITNEFDKTYNYILIKSPQANETFFTSYYNDYIKIFIIRNPLWVYSSINRRTNYNITPLHYFDKYVNSCKLFLKYKDMGLPNCYFIRYEDMFENNYKNLKTIFDNIGFKYTDDIFDNSKYVNKSHSIIKINKNDLSGNKITDAQHQLYRNWQVNEPFENNNTIDKLDLSDKQIQQIISNQYINLIYPNIHYPINKT